MELLESHSGAPDRSVLLLNSRFDRRNRMIERTRHNHTVRTSASEKEGLRFSLLSSLEFRESKIGELVLAPNSQNIIGLDVAVPPGRNELDIAVNNLLRVLLSHGNTGASHPCYHIPSSVFSRVSWQH